jgi:RNA polymerase sigma-70 factor (ECF subfamily)
MDSGLVDRARRGDHDAFERLAGAAAPRLDSVARLITGDPELAKDAVQEALIRAWRDLPTLRDPERFDAWLRRLLARACTDVLRRVRRHSLEIELTDMHHPRGGDPAPALADRDLLERAFRRLDVEQRAVVVIHYYLGLPLADVADVLEVPVGTAKSRLARALGTLRLALGADAPSRRETPEGRFA